MGTGLGARTDKENQKKLLKLQEFQMHISASFCFPRIMKSAEFEDRRSKKWVILVLHILHRAITKSFREQTQCQCGSDM